MTQTWSITQLAQEYDVTLRTLRHYEQLGLLSPERVGSTRVYRQRDRVRLELILRGKRLGFSLDQIGVIVNMYDEPPGEAGQLEFLIAQCDVRRTELHRLRDDIEATLVEIDRVEQRCRADLRALAGHCPDGPADRPGPGAQPIDF